MEEFGSLLPEMVDFKLAIFFWKAINQILANASEGFGKHE